MGGAGHTSFRRILWAQGASGARPPGLPRGPSGRRRSPSTPMGPGPLALIWSPDSRGASYCLPALYIQESRKLQTQHRRSNIPLRATGARWRISQRFILLEVVGVATVILALGACGLGVRAALLATTSACAVFHRSAMGCYLPYLRARRPPPGAQN